MSGRTFYRSGAELDVIGHGQQAGQQRLSVLKRDGIAPCPKTGCKRWEEGWSVTLNLNDPDDANLMRFIREGKMGRFEEERMAGLTGGVRIHFPPGQCVGHKPWENPVYIVGERKTVQSEWHERLDTGARALIAAVERKNEMMEEKE